MGKETLVVLNSSQFDTFVQSLNSINNSLSYLEAIYTLLMVGIATGISICIVYMFYSLINKFI